MEFYLSTNPGEPLKPLSLVASGGEVSRIMLAIKTVFEKIDPAKTLVFDEVDTGVSGATANSMGKLLKGLSSKKQLIVVTHLPQIASKSDTHLYSYKIIEKSRTMGKLKSLDDKARKNEIARMLSGEEITKHSLKQAERFILDG